MGHSVSFSHEINLCFVGCVNFYHHGVGGDEYTKASWQLWPENSQLSQHLNCSGAATILLSYRSPRVRARVRVCVCGCAFLPVRGSDSLTLSFASNVLWPGKCLGFGFPGSRAMAYKLLLLFCSPSPNPKASLDPSMLCWGWQDFLTPSKRAALPSPVAL